VIHIKRFQYTALRRDKLCTEVTFPVHDLDIRPFVSSDKLECELLDSELCSKNNYLYDLAAVAHHSGSMNSGHYIAHVDTNSGNINTAPNWVCFNDSSVSVTTASSVNGPSAYVLFYRKKSSSLPS
jgi:ubiquitin C-terminal hydrolase